MSLSPSVDSPPSAEPARSVEVDPAGEDARASIWYCLRIFIGVRIGLALLALLATALLEPLPATSVPGWPAPPDVAGWGNLFSAWERWDALWFLRIATLGYEAGDGSAAFFPLYPLLIRGVSVVLGGHPLAAALLVSNSAFLVGLVIVFRLTALEFGTAMARRTVLYMAVFPTAFFFLAPYSESLFLALSAAALYSARLGRWPMAGTTAALAASTRSIGIILALPLAIEALSQATSAHKDRIRTALVGLGWSAVTVLGAASYLWFWHRKSGDALTPLSAQDGWLREFRVPTASLVDGTREAFRFVGAYPGGYHQIDLLFVVFALAAAVWVIARARASYATFVVLSLVIPMSLIFGGRPFMSMPRFILVAFPLFWAAAWGAERFRAHAAIVAVSGAGLGILTLLFVNWYFVF